jgi:hypothetical protein
MSEDESADDGTAVPEVRELAGFCVEGLQLERSRAGPANGRFSSSMVLSDMENSEGLHFRAQWMTIVA